MEKFFSCDWGTTSFRLRLVETARLEVLQESASHEGIAGVFEQWRLSGEQDRIPFYRSIIYKHIQAIARQLSITVDGIPVVVSGMASATIGMVELPYSRCPFTVDGTGLEVQPLPAASDFPHPLIIISGARTDNDVMRGEETQLAGVTDHPAEQLLVFPGTHSKHIQVRNGAVTDITTYMTGEVFELLSRKSILAVSVESGSMEQLRSFEKGVADSLLSPLLHNIFLVRTNQLFGKYSLQENYYYLSGLLIGAELGALENRQLTLVCNDPLKRYYETACRVLGITLDAVYSADQAIIKGQWRICRDRLG